MGNDGGRIARLSIFVILAIVAGAALAVLPQSQLALLAGVVVALVAVLAIFAEPALGIALVMLAGPMRGNDRQIARVEAFRATLAEAGLALGTQRSQ